MSDDNNRKADAQIFKKPIHHKATRKVSAIPKELINRSARPDGEKANKVEDGSALDYDSDAFDVDIDDGGLFDDVFNEVTGGGAEADAPESDADETTDD